VPALSKKLQVMWIVSRALEAGTPHKLGHHPYLSVRMRLLGVSLELGQLILFYVHQASIVPKQASQTA